MSDEKWAAVVLTADDADVERLAEALAGCNGDNYLEVARSTIAALLSAPPIPEPNGLGAVVEGDDWYAVFTGREWSYRENDGLASYSEAYGDLPTPHRIRGHGVACSCGGPGCDGGE